MPGTVTGDFWTRTQVTGGGGGLRSDFARRGYFFDLYSISTYQDVTSGGLKTGRAFVQNTQLAVNVDTGRAGLWAGELFHFTVQSRYGSSPQDTFTVGSYVPQYTGLLEPGPLFANDTFPSEYYLVQSLSNQFSVVLGKINVVYLPDHTLFGGSYKYYFANFNFNENPMATNFYSPTAWAALGVYTPTNWLTIAGGVLDPNSKSDNLADNAFDRVNLYVISILSYSVGGFPGQFSPSFNWSNKPQLDLKSPFGALSPEMIQPALAVLVAGASGGSLPTNFKEESWAAIANISQYLLFRDDAATVATKIKSGQPLRGVGVFGRAGYAPEETNRIARDASVALFAHGLADWRAYDSFGVGFYHNQVSRDLKRDITQLTANTINLKDEKGIEVFYNFALTPAIRLILSYQHIWDPLAAQVAAGENAADLFLGRISIAW